MHMQETRLFRHYSPWTEKIWSMLTMTRFVPNIYETLAYLNNNPGETIHILFY